MVTGTAHRFHGVRYARADRFGVPVRCDLPALPEPGGRSHAAPQLPSRLESVTGAAEALPQSEDCLELVVTVPDIAHTDPLPVFVWIHGGAYLIGAGGWSMYDATAFAVEGELIVVSINYRVGVLGYLYAAGISGGNLGLLDQITALEWVRNNIALFGGDPDRVTVGGQSAGAQSIVAMLGIKRTRKLFRRAIIQSAPLGLGFSTTRRARRAARAVLTRVDGDIADAGVTAILSAQAGAVRALAGPGALNATPPFTPVSGVEPLPEPGEWEAEVTARAAEAQILIGTTKHEAAAYLLDPHPVYSRIRRLPIAGRPFMDTVQKTLTRKIFENGSAKLADLMCAHGATVHSYRIPPPHPAAPFGACHCIELPLLFGDRQAWAQAPMLRNIPVRVMTEHGKALRHKWIGFIRDGEPGWRAYVTGSAPENLAYNEPTVHE